MKKFIILMAILILLLSNQTKVLDTAVYEDVEVEILSKHSKYGDEIKVKNKDKSFKVNVRGMNPWKIQFCNVDGGEPELAIGVYKKSIHHRENAKRVFLYNIDFENERLKPKLRISRLNNPLIDYIMYDIDDDGLDEIVSIEEKLNGKFEFGGYNWTSFSFVKDYRGQELTILPKFSDTNGEVLIDGVEREIILDGKEIKWR